MFIEHFLMKRVRILPARASASRRRVHTHPMSRICNYDVIDHKFDAIVVGAGLIIIINDHFILIQSLW